MEQEKTAKHSLCPEDHQAIQSLLIAYGTAIDGRDWNRFQNCFTDDCEADYGDFGKWNSAAEITQYMESAHAQIGPTLHRITNIETHSKRGLIFAKSYVDALLLPLTKGEPVHRGIGYYEDQVVKTGEAWRIARRQFIAVLIE